MLYWYYYTMKLLSNKEKKTEQEKVDERREEVLAQGRKFKYPLQWTKHRIVMSTVLIAVVVIAVIIVGGWLALYRFNMTDDMLFRITKILPISVATVDDEAVRFSDYLMLYRSSITSIERQSGQVDNDASIETLRAQYRRAALTEAEKYSYAVKLAHENDVSVSDENVDAEFERHLHLGGVERSEESFVKIVEDNFGLSKSEYKRMLYLTLLKARVEEKIDKKASEIANKVEKMLSENDGNYTAVAEALGEEIVYEETGGFVSAQNIDGGRASEAFKLEPGKQSGKFVSVNGDGYYFVKLVSKNDTQVNFVSIKVPFTEFQDQFNRLKDDNKISEFIQPSEEEENQSQS